MHIKNIYPDSKVHVANMGPTWGRQDTSRPHVAPMNLAIWVSWAFPVKLPQVNATRNHRWLFNFDSCKRLVPSWNKPLLGPVLISYYDSICCHNDTFRSKNMVVITKAIFSSFLENIWNLERFNLSHTCKCNWIYAGIHLYNDLYRQTTSHYPQPISPITLDALRYHWAIVS